MSSNQSEPTNELGIEVSELTRSSRREYGVGSRDEGVIVTSVKDGSVSANAGIQVGDLITRVGTKKCKSPEEFKRLLEQTRKRDMVMLHLKRDGNARYMTLELED